MNITRFAIEKNRVTLALLAVLVFGGLSTYQGMPKNEDPGFLIRVAVVTTAWPGASPERVEQLITDKLEKVIQEIPELDDVSSQSRTGLSIISVTLKDEYTDLQPVWDNLRRKVERVEGDLPVGSRKPIVDDEFADVFGTLINITGDGFSYAELKDVADEVRDEMLLLEDVAKVELYGAQEERVFVEYSNAQLSEVGIAPSQLEGILAARNIVSGGGDIRTEDETIVLEPTGNFESVEQLKRTLLPLPGGELIYLQDVANVYRGYIDPSQTMVRASGEPGICLAIAMRDGGNLIDLGVELRAEMERIAVDYPVGVDFDFVQIQGEIVAKKVDDFVSNLLQAVAIVLVVMLLSLGLRTGLVVASLIPMAIVTAFIFMPMTGVGIDQMSLAALIIALGLLVDNAIVMSENIMVQMADGRSAKDAAISSAAELRIPLLISSLTTAAAFLPIFLAESAVGEYTAPLFKVVTTTLLCSWALSLTMIPMLCVMFLRVKKRESGDPFATRFYSGYRAFLLGLVRHPWLAVAGTLAIFFGSLSLFGYIPVIFFPESDRPTLVAQLIYPVGTPIQRTEETVLAVEEFIETELQSGGVPVAVSSNDASDSEVADGVTSWTVFLGDGGPRFYLGHSPEQANSGYALMLINTTTREYTDIAVERLTEFTRQFPGLRADIAPLAAGPPAGTPIVVRLSGREADRVFELADDVKAKLASMAAPVDITDDWGARSKKLIVDIDEDRAQRAGVTHRDIATSLETVFSGYQTTEYREDDKVIPVILRSEQASGVELTRFGSINVFSQSSGQSVPVEQVADIRVTWQPSEIRRRDRRTTVAVSSELQPGYTVAAVMPEIEAWLEEESSGWPPGYTWELGGETEAQDESNASIGAKLPIAGLLILMLLIAQFNSVRRTAIILLTIPLGLIGVIIGLLALRSYFGFMTMLGVISLAGIVINNAIVLIDRIDTEIRDQGLSAEAAVVESAQRRLRPILLTTLTTLGGMIPLYLGGGPMFESMAAAIMVGLVFATALTLGFVPVLYTLFFRLKFKDYEYSPSTS